MRAVGSTIRCVACEDDGTLQIQFSNGDSLIVYANDPSYEAYTLLIDSKEVVV